MSEIMAVYLVVVIVSFVSLEVVNIITNKPVQHQEE